MIAWIKNIWGRVTSPFYKMVTPEQEEAELFGSINALNKQAFELNKGIAPNEGVKAVPLQKEIYRPAARPRPVQHNPQPPAPSEQPVQPVQHVQPQQDLSPLIDRVTSLEKQVTRFVNLIERNVAKNAKEINIRIKLNETNDSTDSK